MVKEYNVQLKDALLYKVMEVVRAIVEGSEKDKYSNLWGYYVDLHRSNPNSTI